MYNYLDTPDTGSFYSSTDGTHYSVLVQYSSTVGIPRYRRVSSQSRHFAVYNLLVNSSTKSSRYWKSVSNGKGAGLLGVASSASASKHWADMRAPRAIRIFNSATFAELS